MLKRYFLRCNTIYLMIVEHEALNCKTQLLLIPQFCYIVLSVQLYVEHSSFIKKLQNFIQRSWYLLVEHSFCKYKSYCSYSLKNILILSKSYYQLKLPNGHIFVDSPSIPRGKFVDISSILKGESTWKL